jgi:DMSO/TMAO reductase YedYZ molybdopterin-dependent catalytic subunit
VDDEKKRMPGKSPVIVKTTVSRRSLLEWLGKATVLTLSGELAAACTLAKHQGSNPHTALGHDENLSNQGQDELDCKAERYPFKPGSKEHTVYEEWPERTVDEQNLYHILKTWRLQVDGMVQNPLELSFPEMLQLKRQDQITDFHCVEGWSVYDVPWNGVHLKTLLEQTVPNPMASHITLHCLGDEYIESLPLSVALEDKSLLAYGINCATLPLPSGFPLRMVVPRKYAYKSAKYVYRIELTNGPVKGYWERFGYSYEADVPEMRLREGMY